MTTHNFAGVNTTISVREQSFLTREKWNQLLDATDHSTVSVLLQGTPYEMSVEQLQNPDEIERVLMRILRREYRFLFEESPQSEIIELFSAQYLYHNLKVLMKMKATGQDFEHLLIPIGRFSMDTLRHLVDNLESTVAYPKMVEEVNRTWSEYEAYQLTDAIDVGFDGAYFAHLRMLESNIQDERVAPVVNVLIDFYNVIAIKRAMELGKPKSFMHTMTTSRGTQEKGDLIDIINEGQLAQWFEKQSDRYYGATFDPYTNAMNQASISASQLEKLSDQFLHQFFYEHRLDTDGPLQVMRYIFGKEMEIKNLRLVLTGRANGLSRNQIEERMVAIYGETV